MREAVGFIGLGLLGLPMARNLLAAGHPLRVYNRTAGKAEPLVAAGAQPARRPADVVTRGGIVVSVVWDDAALGEVVGSEGLLDALGPGGLHIAMSTVLPETSRQLAALHARHGATYVEAPIFGRPEAAAARKLWIPIAGPAQTKERARPVIEAMGAQGIFDFGEAIGAATTVKLAGNFLLISTARSLSEALTMAERSGVDPGAVVEMLTTTLFNAPIFQSYGRMIAGKQPMHSPIPLKDIGLFRRTAADVHAPTPLAETLHALLREPAGPT